MKPLGLQGRFVNELDAELEHAGEGTALSPQMLLLEQLRITPEKELKPMEFLFKGNLPVPSKGGEKRREERLPQLNAEYIVHSDDGGDGWQFDVMRLFLDAMRGREEIGGAELRSEVCRLANITQYKFYNKLLQRAQDEKVIVKVERDRHTFYHPSPF